MKKIGIYLEAGPACGGTYQYNKHLLDALLLQTQFKLCVIYGAMHFAPLLNNKAISSQYIFIPRFWSKLLGIWRRIKLPINWLRALMGVLHPLAKAMQKQQCDLWIFPSQDTYAYLMKVNALTTIHDLMHRFEGRFPEVGQKKEFQWREFHYRQSCYYAKGILVDSRLGQQHVSMCYAVDSEKCHVLPYIAPKDLRLSHTDHFEKKFSLPSDFLFYPAQFWEHKNHENLLKALAIVRQNYPDVALVLVGSPKNAFEKVFALIKTLQLEAHVSFLGLVDDSDIPELYRRARALVMPTFFGPTNIPPLEAFAMGCPVMISGIYGMKDQLGEAALFCDPNSVEDLAHKMTMIWTDSALRERLVTQGKLQHSKWNFEHFEKKLGTILEKMLSEKIRAAENVITGVSP